MSELTETEHEPTVEKDRRLDYVGYRTLVDELNQAFRKTGIVDRAGFDRAMRDPRTVRLQLAGFQLPLLTPIEHVAGYDIRRSQQLTGHGAVQVLSLPLSVLSSQEVDIVPSSTRPQELSIIVETDHTETTAAKRALPDLLAPVGDFVARDFLDKRISSPELQPAFMAMYQARFVAVDEQGEQIPARGVNFLQAYAELEQQVYPLTQHTKLLDVHELRENEPLVEELWELCKDRFEWLGEFHPVSMEDTRDFYQQLVLHDDTHTLVRYDDQGQVACLGFFISGLDECRWIKQQYRESLATQAHELDEQLLYFYGIASKSQYAEHYMRDIVQLLSRITKQAGGVYQMTFESTNMSSQYIPAKVAEYVGQSDGVRLADRVHQIARQDYWYLAPARSD